MTNEIRLLGFRRIVHRNNINTHHTRSLTAKRKRIDRKNVKNEIGGLNRTATGKRSSKRQPPNGNDYCREQSFVT